MKSKKYLYSIIIALSLTTYLPMNAMINNMIFPNVDDSLQTVLNFFNMVGGDAKDAVIEQIKKHPYIAQGLAGYVALCYARALLNKYKIPETISEKTEKGYNNITRRLNAWEFVYGGFANIWRIPSDWIIKPFWNKVIYPSPNLTTAVCELFLSSPIIPISAISLNKFLKSELVSNFFEKQLESKLSPDTKNICLALASVAAWYKLSPIVGLAVKQVLFGDDMRNHEKLYKNQDQDNKEGPSVKSINPHDPEYARDGEFDEQSQDIIRRAKKKFTGCLLYGPPGTGKTLDAVCMAKEAGASSIYKITLGDIDSLYLSGAGLNVKNKLLEILNEAQKNPSQRFAIILDDAEQLMLTRASKDLADKESSKTTMHLMNIMDDLKKLDNIMIFSTTNLVSDIDTAAMRRVGANEMMEKKVPTKNERSDQLKGHVKRQKVNISDDVIDHIVRHTEGFPASNIKPLVEDLGMILEKDSTISSLTMEHSDLINQTILKQLDKILLGCESSKKKIMSFNENGETVKKNLNTLKDYIDTLKKNESEINNQTSSKHLLLNLSELKNSIKNGENISEIKEMVIQGLDNYYENLPKTNEQMYLNKQIGLLKGENHENYENFTQPIKISVNKYFIYGKSTSLYKQIELINKIIVEFEKLEKDLEKNKEKSYRVIKELIDELQQSFTYSTKETGLNNNNNVKNDLFITNELLKTNKKELELAKNTLTELKKLTGLSKKVTEELRTKNTISTLEKKISTLENKKIKQKQLAATFAEKNQEQLFEKVLNIINEEKNNDLVEENKLIDKNKELIEKNKNLLIQKNILDTYKDELEEKLGLLKNDATTLTNTKNNLIKNHDELKDKSQQSLLKLHTNMLNIDEILNEHTNRGKKIQEAINAKQNELNEYLKESKQLLSTLKETPLLDRMINKTENELHKLTIELKELQQTQEEQSLIKKDTANKIQLLMEQINADNKEHNEKLNKHYESLYNNNEKIDIITKQLNDTTKTTQEISRTIKENNQEIDNNLEKLTKETHNSLKEKLQDLKEAKQLQLDDFKSQSEKIADIDDSKKMIEKLEDMSIQVVTKNQSEIKNFQDTIKKTVVDEDLEKVLDDALDYFQKNFDIKSDIVEVNPKEKKKEPKKITHDERDVIIKATSLSEKIGASIEETEFLIQLIHKKTDTITENDLYSVYNDKNYSWFKPYSLKWNQSYFFSKWYLWLKNLFSVKTSNKDLHLAMALKKIAIDKNIEKYKEDDYKLIKLASTANKFKDTLTDEDKDTFNILLYGAMVEKEERKKMKLIMKNQFKFDEYKQIKNKKISEKNGKIFFNKNEEITHQIKLLERINKIPTTVSNAVGNGSC